MTVRRVLPRWTWLVTECHSVLPGQRYLDNKLGGDSTVEFSLQDSSFNIAVNHTVTGTIGAIAMCESGRLIRGAWQPHYGDTALRGDLFRLAKQATSGGTLHVPAQHPHNRSVMN